MYIANVNEDGFENNLYLDTVNQLAVEKGAVVVPTCAAVESELIELEDEEKQELHLWVEFGDTLQGYLPWLWYNWRDLLQLESLMRI